MRNGIAKQVSIASISSSVPDSDTEAPLRWGPNPISARETALPSL